MYKFIILALIAMTFACTTTPDKEYDSWETIELALTSSIQYDNPYTDIELYIKFKNEAGEVLKRPAFYDGDQTWKVRFSSPHKNTTWYWSSVCSDEANTMLHNQSGEIHISEEASDDEFLRKGNLKPSPGKRNVVHADGSPFLLVGDTPWSIPFRATPEQVEVYANDRQKKGFNAALMMVIQPDMKAEGPDARNTPLGFARGFSDLADGHINNLNVEYFQTLDTFVEILLDHEIVPVYQPVFHGFGWKGLDVLGNYIVPEEYVRFCKYLLARYGSKPAFWLIAGDNGGNDPGVKEAGEMLEEWDAYEQPVGLHYNPCDDYVASWAENNPLKHCMHFNKMYQDEDWLDFQWAQTGHVGEHQYHKVERMYNNKPTKMSANGEPTYEGMYEGKAGLGWWQGEEAWMQLMSGGTMGVVYGSPSLWQWRITPDEEGWDEWANSGVSWKGALDLEGSTYVGLLGKILEPYNLTDIEKDWEAAGGKPLLRKGSDLFISYLNEGGSITIEAEFSSTHTYKWMDPKTGRLLFEDDVTENTFLAPKAEPVVLVISDK